MTSEEKAALVKFLTDRDALSGRLAELFQAQYEGTVAQGEAAIHGEGTLPSVIGAIAALAQAEAAERVGIWLLALEAILDLLAENNRHMLQVLRSGNEGQ